MKSGGASTNEARTDEASTDERSPMVTTTVTVTEESLSALQDALLQTETGRARVLKVAVVRLRNYLFGGVSVALVGAVLMWLVPDVAAVSMALLAAAFLISAFPAYNRYALRIVKLGQAKAVRAVLEEQRALGATTLTYEFDAAGATIRSPFSTVVLPWPSMLGAIVAGPYFFIVRRDYRGLIVDTRALAPGEFEELQGYMLAAGVPQLR